jgi:hypothetical protein
MLRSVFLSAVLLSGVAQAQDIDALKLDTRKNALPVLPKVVAMMQDTVATRGVVEAIPVCKDQAPQLLKEQSEKTGWKMSRVSLKDTQSRAGYAGCLGSASACRLQHPRSRGREG